MLILLNISCMLFLLYRCQIENVYIHQRHCSLLIVYNLKSQTKHALLQLKAGNKIYKGANRLGRRTGKSSRRHRGERKSRRNDLTVKRLSAKGNWGKRLRCEWDSGRNDSDLSKYRYKTSTGSDQTGYKMTKLKIKGGTK